MWISNAHYRTMDELITSAQERNTEMLWREGGLQQELADLRRENQRLLDDQKFFMHRLNQVEMERAQLIHAAIGIKLAVPTFKAPEPTQDEILNNNGNPFIGMGEDSPDPQDQLPHHQDGTEDLSHMPGFNKR